MKLRLKSLRKKIVSKKLDGFVSFDPLNIFYLTGFRAENSFVFVSPKDIYLVVSELSYPSAKKHSDCKRKSSEGSKLTGAIFPPI